MQSARMFINALTISPCDRSTDSVVARPSILVQSLRVTNILPVISRAPITKLPEEPARTFQVRGWHDAGDYGRYIVNSGISTGQLLWTWELFGSRIRNVKLNIPESSNSTPDILDEIRWNLDWMLTMQDDDGGVWHKQTSERFADFVMPEDDKLVSYVIGTGSGTLQEFNRDG